MLIKVQYVYCTRHILHFVNSTCAFRAFSSFYASTHISSLTPHFRCLNSRHGVYFCAYAMILWCEKWQIQCEKQLIKAKCDEMWRKVVKSCKKCTCTAMQIRATLTTPIFFALVQLFFDMELCARYGSLFLPQKTNIDKISTDVIAKISFIPYCLSQTHVLI